MAEAFFGYLLPWGQMSYWGAQVIVNLFAAIPFIGPELSIWIRGDYVVSDATLNRFFAFHVIAIPLVLVGLVAAHLVALHEVGSNNPEMCISDSRCTIRAARGSDTVWSKFHPSRDNLSDASLFPKASALRCRPDARRCCLLYTSPSSRC